jgi:hypothetical protein
MTSRRILKCLYPHNLTLVAVMLSIVAWSIPDIENLRHGFYVREPLTAVGVLVLVLWYGTIYLFSRLGFNLGRRCGNPARYLDTIPLARLAPYYGLVCFAIIGMLATYYQVFQVRGLAGMIQSIARNTMNDFKAALYQDYSIGLVSLRYVSAICGGIGMWRLMNRSRSPVNVVAVACWVATAAVASRLSILWGLLTALTLWLTSIDRISAKVLMKLGCVALTAFLLLWTLNYTRNANYYRARGAGGFGMSGVSELVAYLGSPFQVSLGIANHFGEALNGTPTAELVQWDHGLNTDSALENVVQTMGYWAFPYMFITVFVYSLIAGFCFRMRGTWLFLGFPIIGYAFAEIWRLDLFRQGIFFTNLTVGLTVPWFMAKSRGALRRPGWGSRRTVDVPSTA